MFCEALSFNQPLSDWRVDNVNVYAQDVLPRLKSFNQPLGDWRVDKVTNMCEMFATAPSFNQPLNDWRVDNVTICTGCSKKPRRSTSR